MSPVMSSHSHLRHWLSWLLPSSRSIYRDGTGSVNEPSGTIDLPTRSKANSLIEASINKPEPVVSKIDGHQTVIESLSRRPTDVELDTIKWGHRLSGPKEEHIGPSRIQEDIESRPGSGRVSPVNADDTQATAYVTPTIKHPYMNRWRIAACCIAFFIQGVNDSAPGALLPYMERYYSIRYAMVSLIFVANALGFIIAAPFCHKLNNRFGRARVLSACTILNFLAYTALVCQPPFAVVVIAFLLLGYGFATILALDNVFIINLAGGTSLLGYMHGFYGIGGTTAPFMATAMVSSGIRWSYFYCIPLSLSAVSTAAFFATFRSYETETFANLTNAAASQTLSRQTTMDDKKDILKRALKNRTTLLGALLIFAYQGAEVSISGWVISFLIDYRSGDPSQVGYVTAGFWGGITLGRFLLVTPAHKIGDRVSVLALTIGTAAFQLLLWFLPNVIGNAVAVAVIGLLLGPIYPCATGVFSRLLPAHLQITSLGLIGSVGSSGGAIFPFLTGILAQGSGTVVLNPVCIVLYVVMIGAWLGVPRVVKRRE